MLASLFEGMLFGLPFVLVIGPALFAILQTSMNKGFYSGMQLAIGISISDWLLMLLCYYGLAQHMQNPKFQMTLGFIGSIFLLGYGLYIFIKKTPTITKKQEIKLNIKWGSVFSEISKGFFLNIMNPFLWVLWLTIITTGTANKSRIESLLFILGIAAILFASDVLKSFFANKIVKMLSPKIIAKVNKMMGIVLIICSVVLFVRTIITIC
ncbi:MAG: LysE family transporter [Bacteroidales bacterium]|nr:LysE family transporter [Bacteroidales bacterium]